MMTLAAAAVCARAAAAATLSIAPSSGFGRPGEALQVSGAGFRPSATLSITVGDAPVVPDPLTTDAAGALPPSVVLLAAPLANGKHDVVAAGAVRAVARGAYGVRPLVTLDPPIGDGRAGATWRTAKTIATGGHQGMVFAINGTGFPADSFIPGDSIRVGKALTIHDPIRVGKDGVVPSTTVVVASALQSGRYDVVFAAPGAGPLIFAAAYSVAPWAATDAIRQRAAARRLEASRRELRDLVAVGGDALPGEDVTDVTNDLKGAETELKSGNYENAEELSRQIHDKLVALGKQAAETRREKLRGLADVIAAGFDTIQPPGTPPSRQAGASVDKGRKKLDEAQTAIAAARFDEARALLKASNDLLKKARADAGVKAEAEPIRW